MKRLHHGDGDCVYVRVYMKVAVSLPTQQSVPRLTLDSVVVILRSGHNLTPKITNTNSQFKFCRRLDV